MTTKQLGQAIVKSAIMASSLVSTVLRCSRTVERRATNVVKTTTLRSDARRSLARSSFSHFIENYKAIKPCLRIVDDGSMRISSS